MNIGTGRGSSGTEIIAHAGRVLARDLVINHDPTRVRPHDRPHLVTDPQRLKSILTWWPATSIDNGIAATIAATTA